MNTAKLLHHELPLRLLSPLYLQAFPDGAGHDDVMWAFTRNTQQRFDRVVESFLAGRTCYNPEAYSQRGPAHSAYSHIEHLGWIYHLEIKLVLRILEGDPSRTVTVVDLGTGAGHFAITLAEQLVARGLLDRTRIIGIDRELHRDMVYGIGVVRERGLAIEFLEDDVANPEFPDRLRRLRPDVIVANHVLEHLEREIQNRYLQDWLLATQHAMFVSVPLKDNPRSSLSDHTDTFDADRVTRLARSMELRVGYAVEAEDIEGTRDVGLIQWIRTPEVRERGGFSGGAYVLRPNDVVPEPDPILADFSRPFDPAEFNRLRRAPKIGEIRDKTTFAQPGDRPRQVRQLLIKGSGTDVFVPEEFGQFREAIKIIIDHNRAANPDYASTYGYLNVFRGMTGFSSYRGLSLNCHGDQLQTLKEGYAFPPDWSYIVSNTLPTTLFEQPFDISEAVARARAGEAINLYGYLNKQADRARAYHSDNFEIYLLSPYVVHSASDAQEDAFRVFMKVAFSTKRFSDNRELRRNPAFNNSNWPALKLIAPLCQEGPVRTEASDHIRIDLHGCRPADRPFGGDPEALGIAVLIMEGRGVEGRVPFHVEVKVAPKGHWDAGYMQSSDNLRGRDADGTLYAQVQVVAAMHDRLPRIVRFCSMTSNYGDRATVATDTLGLPIRNFRLVTVYEGDSAPPWRQFLSLLGLSDPITVRCCRELRGESLGCLPCQPGSLCLGLAEIQRVESSRWHGCHPRFSDLPSTDGIAELQSFERADRAMALRRVPELRYQVVDRSRSVGSFLSDAQGGIGTGGLVSSTGSTGRRPSYRSFGRGCPPQSERRGACPCSGVLWSECRGGEFPGSRPQAPLAA
jgi:hypothetical protein